MLPQERSTKAKVDSKTYPLVENREQVVHSNELAIIALSHTQLEHRLYLAMLAIDHDVSTNRFTARHLMDLTGIKSLSTVRRGLEGLLIKLSIDKGDANGGGRRDNAHEFRVYSPNEIIARRRERGSLGLTAYAQETPGDGNHAFSRAISRVAENPMLSRREAQVALFCVQGLTNAVIGERLNVSEQTVKFHLRHIFLKFGVKRRAELISKLLM
ncbi:MAG TPA: LuxR C-terminal-related transcriptional regulator [Pyrinomonadaceae bacterium]|jgi:DNA-binding CsgD family transcriptional regulator